MAEDPRPFLHFKTFEKFQLKLLDGTINPDKHFVVIKDEGIIWIKGKTYSDNNRLKDLDSYYNDWEILQPDTDKDKVTITLKGKTWEWTEYDEDNKPLKGHWIERKKTIQLNLVSEDIAGLMSTLDKIKLNRITRTNHTISNPVTTGTERTIKLTSINPDNGVDASTSITIPSATQDNAGLMSSTDKKAIDNLSQEPFSHIKDDQAFTSSADDVKLNFSCRSTTMESTTPSTEHSIPIGAASSTKAGVMTAEDKRELDRIGTANFNVSSVSTTATNVKVNADKTNISDPGTLVDNSFTIPLSTADKAGVMIAEDKRLLDLITSANFELTTPTTTDTNIILHTKRTNINSETTGVTDSEAVASRTLPAATTEKAGVMTADDKTELDRITTANFGLGAVTTTDTLVNIAASKLNIDTNEVIANNITIPESTTSKAGAMSSSDKIATTNLKTAEDVITELDDYTRTATTVTTNYKNISAKTSGATEVSKTVTFPMATTKLAGAVTDKDKIALENIKSLGAVTYLKDVALFTNDTNNVTIHYNCISTTSEGDGIANHDVTIPVSDDTHAGIITGTEHKKLNTDIPKEISDVISGLLASGKTTAATAVTELAKRKEGFRTLAEIALKLEDFLTIENDTDEVINKWKDIESFLAGIKDTDTLVGIKTGLETLITNEKNRAIGQEDKIEAAVGLNADGTHKTTTGNYTKSATTIAGEISALDTQVKKNEDAITLLNNNSTTSGSISHSIKTAIEALDVTDTAVTNQFVTAVSETDGKISVSRARPTAGNISNTAITASDTQVGLIGTDVQTTISNIASAIKTEEKARIKADSDEVTNRNTAITNAINDLDATITSTDGTNLQVKVTETNGKVSAVNVTTDNTINRSNIKAGTGISLTKNETDRDTTINHSNSVTAATNVSGSTGVTPGFGETANIPHFSYDAQGHITGSGTHTITIPNTEATTSARGLLPASDKKKLNAILCDDTGINYIQLAAASTNSASISVEKPASDKTRLTFNVGDNFGVSNYSESPESSGDYILFKGNQVRVAIGKNLESINPTSGNLERVLNLTDKSELSNSIATKVDETTTVNGHALSGNVTVTKSDVSLGNVTNDSQVKRSEMGAASGVATLDANSKIIQNIDASKITSGTISIDRLPQGALERLTIVANAAARKALTTVQNGDTVKETDTGLMYYVKDDTKLNLDAGWEVYTAGAAASVPWSGITDKPNTFTPSSHTHTSSLISDKLTKSTKSNLGWDVEADRPKVVDMSFLAYWDGAYTGTSSNLSYCNLGAFGTMATKNASDYALTSAIPTKVSQLTNDSGYLTSHQSLSNYVDKTSAQEISGVKTFKKYISVDLTNDNNTVAGSQQTVLLLKNKTQGLNYVGSIISVLGSRATVNPYNQDVRFGSQSGSTWISAGENGGRLSSNVQFDDTESVFVSSDTDVQFYVGVNNEGTSYTKAAWINTDGVNALKFIKSDGTSSLFLKADGSVDSNSYALSSSLANYLPLTGGTLTGGLIINKGAAEELFRIQGYYTETNNQRVGMRIGGTTTDRGIGIYSENTQSWGNSCDLVFSANPNLEGQKDIARITANGQIKPLARQGIAPFIVDSTTVVQNLNADLLDGLHKDGFILSMGIQLSQHLQGNWINFLNFTIPEKSINATISFSYYPTECNRDRFFDLNINIRSNNILFYIFEKSGHATFKCVGDGTTFSVWMQCLKEFYDGYGIIVHKNSFGIKSYEYGILEYQDEEPTGTYSSYSVRSGHTALSDVATKLNTARTITIGNTGKNFDGTANVAWSLDEIGAASKNSLENYLPLSGGTLTGDLTVNSLTATRVESTLGFIKKGYDDSYVLLAGGGIKKLSELSGGTGSETVSGDYLPLYGGTLTGSLAFNSAGGISTLGSALNILASNDLDISATLIHLTGLIDATTTSITAKSFIKTGGKATLFLKADGSIDSNRYLTSSDIDSYLSTDGGNLTGNLNMLDNSISILTYGNFYGQGSGYYVSYLKGKDNEGLTISSEVDVIIDKEGTNNINFISRVPIIREGYTDDYVLLAGGGVKAVSTFGSTGGGSGISYSDMWQALASGNLQINKSHLTEALSNYVTLDTIQSITSLKYFDAGVQIRSGGLTVKGRINNNGDDEGIIINYAADGYASLALGSNTGKRSCFILKNDGNAYWRYNNGGTNTYDIIHPAKSGTIALIEDFNNIITSNFGNFLSLRIGNEGENYYMDIVANEDSLTFTPQTIYKTQFNCEVYINGMLYLGVPDYNRNGNITYGPTQNSDVMEFYMDGSSSGKGIFNWRVDDTDVMLLDGTGVLSILDKVGLLSDVRKKNIISDVELNINDIADSPIFKFTWKDRKNTEVHVGTSALYWQSILPETVMENSNGDLLILYDVIALLATVTNSKIILDHENRISELERENRELKDKLYKLLNDNYEN